MLKKVQNPIDFKIKKKKDTNLEVIFESKVLFFSCLLLFMILIPFTLL